MGVKIWSRENMYVCIKTLPIGRLGIELTSKGQLLPECVNGRTAFLQRMVNLKVEGG